MDARGNVTDDMHNNGLVTKREFDPIDGRLTKLYTSLAGLHIAQNQTLHYNEIGNLETWEDQRRGYTESYCYDRLNRLTSTAIDSLCSDSDIRYDNYGNITEKKA